MPTSPPRHNAQRVAQSRKENQKAYNKSKRLNQRFYDSSGWRKLRTWFAKANPLCIRCKEIGRATPLDVVDHIIEIKDGGAPLDQKNLQSLCHAHHNTKTAIERVGRVKSL